MMLKKGPVKEFKTYEEQIDLLEKRGLVIEDRQFAIQILRQTNYYRLSAYSLSLRAGDVFYRDVSFYNIYELYSADASFRRIVMYYCSCVEVAFRSYVAYYLSRKYGPLGYMDKNNFESPSYHDEFMEELEALIDRSDDLFIEHHKRDKDNVFPIWVIVEVMSFGALSKLFKNMLPDDRNKLSKNYVGFHRVYIENWLQCCSYCRNIAAHGGRFYNRKLFSNPVRLSKKENRIDNTRAFAYILAIYKLLPNEHFKENMIRELEQWFLDHPFVYKSMYGFPDDWANYMK